MTGQEALALVEKLLQATNSGQKLNDIQSVIFRETWIGRSYIDISKQLGYDYDYIKQIGSQLWRTLSQSFNEPVSKTNIQAVLRRYQQLSPQQDWGEAVDVSTFYDRIVELQTLQQWVLQDRCRFVGIFGLGGMGKTALSIKLAQVVQSHFQCLIWRSLQQAPSLKNLLSEILPILEGSETTDASLDRLMVQLRQRRCLLVLDNVESILQSSHRSGQYQQGFEDYRAFFERMADEPHQSCLIITGREKPGGFSWREGKDYPVRSLLLTGLSETAGERILHDKGVEAAQPQYRAIVNYFAGNPLTLKIAATTIQDLFGGDIETFLTPGNTVFSDLWDLLQQQFQCLSPLQKQIMYWLAINREGVTLAQLQAEMLLNVPTRELLEALEVLKGQSLIESSHSNLTQQPVIQEYITEILIQTILQEIITLNLNLLTTHALIEAKTQDYLRDAQIQFILQPLTERLLTHFSTKSQLENHFYQILASLRHQTATQIGYAVGNLLNLFCHLKTDLKGFDFSHLVIRQAYLANAILHDTNFSHSQISQTVFAETFGGVLSAVFSPDGEHLAISDTKGEIQIWETQTGEQQLRLGGHDRWTWALVWSPNGQYLASGGDDRTVKLWDAVTRQYLHSYTGHTQSVNAIAWSPDSQILASSGQDTTIRLWQVLPNHSEIQTLIGHQGRVWSIAFSPDGQTLASGGEDCTIRLWDVETGVCCQAWKAHHHWVRSLMFSPDGQLIASGSYDRTLKLWDVETRECLKTLTGHRQPITAVAFSPDGQQLASSSFDRSVKHWDIETGGCLKTFLGHTSRVWTVAYHPHQPQLVSGGDDHATKLWNLQTGRCTKTLTGHTNAVLSLALTPDNRYLASGHEDQTVRVWDLQSGQNVQTLRGHTNRVWSVAFQPLGQTPLLASGSADYKIKLWNPQLGYCLQTLEGHKSWVWSIGFSPDGQQLASSSYDQTVKLWDVSTGKCLKTLLGHTSPVVCVAYSPKGEWLASSEFDGIIKLWDAHTGDNWQTLKGHTNSIWCVTFSPDGQMLLSASFDQMLKLWSVDTGECLRTFAGHQDVVTVARFTPDGQFIVSGSGDRSLKVWEVVTGECLQTLRGHEDLISTLLVTTVSAQLTVISGSFDESIKVWNLPDNTHQHLEVSRPYAGMRLSGVKGLTEAQRATLIALGAISEG